MRGVDVVVPCYNYGRYLNACVGSILGQEEVPVRVLIIDDASDDDSELVGRSLAAADSRVTYRRHAINRGHIATYNEGLLEWASADYALLLSADDLLADGALSRAARLMNDDESIGMTYGMAFAFSGDQPIVRDVRADASGHCVVSGQRFLDYCFAGVLNPVPTPTVVVRTALQKELGGYDPRFPHSGDMEMWMRFASQSRIGVLRDVQAYYRRHECNMNTQYRLQLLGDLPERVLTCRHVIETRLADWPQRQAWSAVLHAAAAQGAFWEATRAFENGRTALCRSYLEFAVELDPRLPRSTHWRRLKLKMLIGRAASSLIANSLDRLRGRSVGSEQAFSKDAGPPASSSGLHGWWPEPSEG